MDFDELLRLALPFSATVILGLVICAFNRRKQWIGWLWGPLVVLMTSALLNLVLPLLRITTARGIDSGWGYMGLIVLVPVMLGLLVGLLISWFARPRSDGWKFLSIVPAMVLTVVALTLWKKSGDIMLEIKVSDRHGRAVQNVPLTLRGKTLLTDSKGIATLPLSPDTEIGIRPGSQFHDSAGEVVSGRTLRFRRDRRDKSHVVIRDSGFRYFGSEGLNETITEIFPSKRHLRISVTLEPAWVLNSPARTKRVMDAFEAANKENQDDDRFESISRNLEATVLIPELIAIQQKLGGGDPAAVKGLGIIAATLAQMDKGVERFGKELGAKAGRPVPIDQQQRIQGLQSWLGEIRGNQVEPPELIVRVRSGIQQEIKTLLDFAIQEELEGRSAGNILRSLRKSAGPLVDEIILQLLVEPPPDLTRAGRWQEILHELRVTPEQLKPLLESENPLLKACTGTR